MSITSIAELLEPPSFTACKCARCLKQVHLMFQTGNRNALADVTADHWRYHRCVISPEMRSAKVWHVIESERETQVEQSSAG
jgi:hypothetical protein